jgi:nitrogen regulatory protein PII
MLDLELLFAITDRSNSENFIQLYQEHRLPLILAALGRGTTSFALLETLGLIASEKAVLFTVATRKKIRSVMREINVSLGIDRPGTSVIFTIPVSSVGGKVTAQFLSESNSTERKENTMESKTEVEAEFELIIAIANEGYSDLLMEAARTKGGATGGTILHARGIGKEMTQKFFGIALSDEKEMALIVCGTKHRNKIMQSILAEAENTKEAGAIVFSLAVSSASGLWTLREQAD